jgi:hypothetical protein
MMNPSPLSRRSVLQQIGCGFGYVALAGLASAPHARASAASSFPQGPHFAPKAKRIIFLFMAGGVSQVDSFDFKPELEKQDGKMLEFNDLRAIQRGVKDAKKRRAMKSLWRFRQHGQSGLWASDLFPQIAGHMDKLCVIRSMHTEGVAHGPATLFLHTGAANFIRPSMGSWLLYGLGTENQNVPGFVSIGPSLGNGGPRNYGNAFLPARYQGTAMGVAGMPSQKMIFRNIVSGRGGKDARRQFELQQALNEEQRRLRPGDLELDAVMESYELAWRMQTHAPGVVDLSRETPKTLEQYGIGTDATDDFGRKCLMARQLSESGVRFVQVNYNTSSSSNPAWDQHSDMPKHAVHASAVDKPIAGLLQDLAERGLLEDTIVWWGGEFGRTPYAENAGTGRDHNPSGFTMWLAGGGFRPGFAYGATDPFGHYAVEDKVHMHDLHATLLHQLGMDHERLTFRHDGRDYRLTDVHGEVVRDLLG